jgi:adenine deaminase
MNSFSRSGMIIDIFARKIFPGTIHVQNGNIVSIDHTSKAEDNCYILPGFIDAHVHVESSMLIPSEFARLASVHGTVATISDPHEIANVLGIEGVRYMIENGKQVPFNFYFGASPCVPATTFETAGATLSADDIEELFKTEGLHYLSEMMNYPGVLHNDPLVLKKLDIARAYNRPVDGHAPGLHGKDATKYIQAGISTDHECYTYDEALEKVSQGMHIIIREGSAAKNYQALHRLIGEFPKKIMFCSDDKHPDALVKGHINELVKRSVIDEGYDLFDVLRIASLNPILHYSLDVGLLRPGDAADFIVIDNLKNFGVLETYVKGKCIARDGKTCIKSVAAKTPNHFSVKPKSAEEYRVAAEEAAHIRVIQAEDGQLVTKELIKTPLIVNGAYEADPSRDILKLVVVNRYKDSPPAVAFITNFGLKHGAIASCVAHDSHNIIAVGCSDDEIARAVNLLIAQQGGIAVVDGDEEHGLPLPVAGIMSAADGYSVAESYSKMDARAKVLGSNLGAPFMTLSFMALLVIPSLKLSDKGLFDGSKFEFVSLGV